MIEKYLKKHAYGISKNHKSSKNSQQNYSETVTNENDKEIPKERYIYIYIYIYIQKKDRTLLII